MIKDANEIKFRAHQVGSIMGGPREKAGELSKTTQSALIKIYAAHCLGIQNSLNSKYLDKGIEAEEDSITLKSTFDKKFYAKNTERKSDDFFTGECDILDGDTIHDIKSSWDIMSHLKKATEPINDEYEWQGQIYMHLYGATKYRICHCLVNTPDHLIGREQMSYLYKLGVSTDRIGLYDAELEDIRKQMTFDHLPLKLRYFEQTFNFDQSKIDKAKDRVHVCRQWIQTNLIDKYND